MNKRIMKLIHSLIGLSVLAMFAVAIVAGQARANAELDHQLEVDVPLSASASITLGLERMQNFEALPIIVETVLEIPLDLARELK